MMRVVPASHFLALFRSDRSHMLRDGEWLSPPPPWPCIDGIDSVDADLRPLLMDDTAAVHAASASGPQSNLSVFWDMEQRQADPWFGEVFDAAGFVSFVRSQSRPK